METDTKYHTITDEEFQKFFKTKPEGLTVIVFTSEWLGSGHMLDGIIERLAEELKEDQVKFYRVDVEASPKTPHQFGIRQLPATFFIKDSEVVYHFSGILSKNKLQETINYWLAA